MIVATLTEVFFHDPQNSGAGLGVLLALRHINDKFQSPRAAVLAVDEHEAEARLEDKLIQELKQRNINPTGYGFHWRYVEVHNGFFWSDFHDAKHRIYHNP